MFRVYKEGAPLSFGNAMRNRSPVPPVDTVPWICCQLGAREHYAVPRALKRQGVPVRMLTDLWCSHRWLPGNGILSSFHSRYHPELSAKEITAFTSRSLVNRLGNRLLRRSWYSEQVAINTSFQKRCIAAMKRIPRDSSTRVVFAYSYAAKDIIDYARNRGWTTVLGQIDPGPEETRIVTEEYNRLGLPLSHFYTPPEGYWEDWRAETALADTIVVNSPWSADCLVSEGVAASKIRIIPCAYTPGSDASAFRRSYPNSFSGERPLKVLFLGQPVIRKGIHLVMEAAEALLGSPLRITVVGGESDLPNIPIPANVDWVGRVPRHNASAFYRDADVFLLPTLSDGFALTQLEASSWKLPLVVSSHCGEVVTDGRNGLVLPELSVSAIATALRTLLAEPDTLRQMSEAAISLEAFGLDAVGGQFVELVQSPSRSPMA